MTINQLSIFLENRSGQLAEITGVLSEHSIDLRAINIAEATDYGVLRLIVDDTARASDVLLRQGYILSMTPVVAAAVPDCPGGLNRLLTIISGADVNIEYMYSVFGQRNGQAYMIFRVNDPEKISQLLADQGISPVSNEQLGIR